MGAGTCFSSPSTILQALFLDVIEDGHGRLISISSLRAVFVSICRIAVSTVQSFAQIDADRARTGYNPVYNDNVRFDTHLADAVTVPTLFRKNGY